MEALWISEIWVVGELEGGGNLIMFPSFPCIACATNDRSCLEMRLGGSCKPDPFGKSYKSGSGTQN